MLLSLLVEESDPPAADLLWNIYYHLYLDEASLKVLERQVARLLAVSKGIDEWKQSVYGKVLVACDVATLRAVRAVWTRFANEASAKKSKERLKNFTYAIQVSKQFRDQRWSPKLLDLTAARSAAPLASELIKSKVIIGLAEDCMFS